MRFFPAACLTETFFGKGPGGTLMLGDFRQRAEELVHRFEGTVQTVYLDPPFNTGKEFVLRQRCGEAGWRDGKPVLQLPAYSDAWTDEAQLIEMLEAAAVTSRALLKKDGSFFMHIDSRLHARVRLMLDKVFGEKAFVNEIIWAYKSGAVRSSTSAASMTSFSFTANRRAHISTSPPWACRARRRVATICAAQWMIWAVLTVPLYHRARNTATTTTTLSIPAMCGTTCPTYSRRIHSARGMTRKSRRGCWSGLLPARRGQGIWFAICFPAVAPPRPSLRRWTAVFWRWTPLHWAIAVTRKRLLGDAFRLEAPTQTGEPVLKGGMRKGIGFLEAWVDEYGLEAGLCPLSLAGDSALDQLSLGYVRGSVFYAYANAARSKLSPALPQALEVPRLDGQLAMLTVDVLGRRMLHLLEDDGT